MKNHSDSKIILTITTGLAILYIIFNVKPLLYLSAVLGLAGLFSDYLGSRIARLWMQLAKILGYINTRILLSIVFFLILTPLAIVRRLFGKEMLDLKNREKKSLFIVRDHTFCPQDLENMW